MLKLQLMDTCIYTINIYKYFTQSSNVT